MRLPAVVNLMLKQVQQQCSDAFLRRAGAAFDAAGFAQYVRGQVAAYLCQLPIGSFLGCRQINMAFNGRAVKHGKAGLSQPQRVDIIQINRMTMVQCGAE